ncbi:MAG: dienelactone hydrolase family protein [Verrucomicrobiales bacterium]|nr:dienelactone hydrolase family protein [Verrucomicrobiales bacterium]
MKPAVLSVLTAAFASVWPAQAGAASADDPSGAFPPIPPLPGTLPLEMTGDIASNLVAGVDRFLLRKTDESAGVREAAWKPGASSVEAWEQSLVPRRKRLGQILGMRDPRPEQVELELVAAPSRGALRGAGQDYEILAVRWPAFGDVTGEGLLLTPVGRSPRANLVAIPDADQTPEQLVGLAEGVPPESQFARRLVESGCQVIVPTLINREIDPQTSLSHREFIQRPAYELGRHVIGYELQKVLAAVDWLSGNSAESAVPIGVMGWGEGGLLALDAAALDPRIVATCVSGHFDDRRKLWQQPVDRNVFGLLNEFGDAELAAMVAPRTLIIEAAGGPKLNLPGGGGWSSQRRGNGAPGLLVSPRLEDVRTEYERARSMVAGLGTPAPMQLIASGETGDGAFGSEPALAALLAALRIPERLPADGALPRNLCPDFDSAARSARQLHELDRHTQQVLTESPYTRAAFMTDLDTRSLEAFRRTAAHYRDYFHREVIGRFEDPVLPPNPRSRVIYDRPLWTGYEVVLDVFPEVMAYGILLVPKGLEPGEQRPVVVCQHGLEGRPQDTITGDSQFYRDFAARLCEEGFVTFAPQNLYLFADRFRTLQRKANPLGRTLYSIMVPQHQQITDWLQTLPFVDPARIGFYGLSYGGKTAMRVPPLVDDYCLAICSGDFNDWVWKCASTRSPYSYVRTPEYEIFEFNLGGTFNYAEMAALIAPRPFMVERGHFDGVAPDETVAYEFAKVRHLYEARLGLQEQCGIEWFTGPHTIHGEGTFEFLRRHLNWPGHANPATSAE